MRLLIIFTIALCLAAHGNTSMYEEVQGNGIYSVAEENDASRRVQKLIDVWQKGGMRKMAQDTDRAVDGIMKIAIRNLRHRGYSVEAKEMEQGWLANRGQVEQLLNSGRDRKITDFEPLSTFLATAYWKLQELLGYEICRALHLDLILTFNYTIKYVFSFMCANPEQEFYWHFVGDDPAIVHPYRGLAPSVAYVLTTITCEVATFGAGIYWLCGPLGMLVEYSMTKWGAPWLSPRVFSMVCSK